MRQGRGAAPRARPVPPPHTTTPGPSPTYYHAQTLFERVRQKFGMGLISTFKSQRNLPCSGLSEKVPYLFCHFIAVFQR